MGIENVSAVSSPTPLTFATPQVESAGARLRISAPASQGKLWNIARSYSDFAELQKINDRVNSTAEIQRTFEKHFEKLNDYIEKMKIQLERILKQFPPFPPGSEDRVHALRSYANFRKMIDQLTIPPPDSLSNESENLAGRSGSATEEAQWSYSGDGLTLQPVEIKISS